MEAIDTIDNFDAFEADAELAAAPTEDALQALSDQVQKALYLQRRIAKGQEFLADLQGQLKTLEERTIVDALDAAKTASFTTVDGFIVAIEDVLSVSVPKDNKQAVCTWLRDIDQAGLITNVLSVPIAKGMDNSVAKIEEFLATEGVTFARISDVNTGSLKALIRRRLEAAQEVPLETCGVFQARKAKITIKK